MVHQRFLIQLTILALSFFVTSVQVYGKDRLEDSAFSQSQLTQIQWKQDVDRLYTKVSKVHPKPWRTISEKKFKSHLQRIVGTSAHDSRNKTAAKLMEAVALMSKAGQDGQSKISAFQKALNFHLLPIRVSAFINGIYIVDASDKYKRLIGNRITKVSGEPIESVLSKVKPFISSDNAHWKNNQAPLYALMPELLEVLDISNGQSIALSMVNQQGRLDKSILRAVSVKEYSQLFQTVIPFNTLSLKSEMTVNLSNKDYFHKQLEESTLYTQINRVSNEQSFAEFIEDVAIEIKKYQLTSLVIDLRNNSGATVTDYSSLREMLDNFKSSRRELDLFVLTNHDTFSAAVFLAIDLKSKHRATLIGEETGGSPDQYIEAEEFLLPNSKLLVNIATRFWKKSTSSQMLLTLTPDYLVTPTSVDYFSGRDPILNKARELIELKSFE